MRHKVLLGLIVSATPALLHAAANCGQSSSWQCRQSKPSTVPVVVAVTLSTGGHTAPLGGTGGTTDHHNVVIVTGTPGPKISGQGLPPPVIGTKGPGFTGHNPLPTTITLIGTQSTFTGFAPVPPVQIQPTPSFSGHGQLTITVAGTPGPTFTGTGPVTPPAGTQGPSFTGQGHTLITVTGTLPPPITGIQPVVPPSGTPGPSITGQGQLPITVTGTLSTFTGFGKVPQPVGTLPPTITGHAPLIVVVIPPPQTVSGFGHVTPPQSTQAPPVTGFAPAQTIIGTYHTFTGFGPVPSVGGTPHEPGTHVPPLKQHPMLLIVGPTAIGQSTGKPVQQQLAVHQPPSTRPVTSGDHAGTSDYNLEFIEPGIQNHKVEVYRSKDMQERIYGDTIPMDAGGFHLRVVGIRNPDYSH